jgi:hypothetical protein
MANVYVEARPKGRPEGSPIEDFVVEDHRPRAQQFQNAERGDRLARKNGHSRAHGTWTTRKSPTTGEPLF